MDMDYPKRIKPNNQHGLIRPIFISHSTTMSHHQSQLKRQQHLANIFCIPNNVPRFYCHNLVRKHSNFIKK